MTVHGRTTDSENETLPAPVAPDGALSYYRRRHGDFSTRYTDAGLTPPTYYLGYGEKYVGRFTNETNDRLTDEGKAWLVRARVNLQTAIEGRRDADPADFDRERDEVQPPLVLTSFLRYSAEDGGMVDRSAEVARGGAIVHHHGIGKARAPWVREEYGTSYPMLETLKRAFDP